MAGGGSLHFELVSEVGIAGVRQRMAPEGRGCATGAALLGVVVAQRVGPARVLGGRVATWGKRRETFLNAPVVEVLGL